MFHNPTDPHRGRPVEPAYAERGKALMAQWAAEDAAEQDEVIDLRPEPIHAAQ